MGWLDWFVFAFGFVCILVGTAMFFYELGGRDEIRGRDEARRQLKRRMQGL